MRFWTLATPGTLAQARVLSAALARVHPGSRLTVVHASPPPPDDGFDAVPLWECEPRLRDLLSRYPWQGVEILARAAVLRTAISRETEPVALLEPATDLHASLAPLAAALEEHDVVLVPRTRAPLPDDERRPSPRDLARWGLQGHSVLGARPGGQADAVLAWWAERVEAGLETMSWRELAALRRRPSARISQWLDLAALTFDSVATLGDPGVGVSAWNLHERELRDGADGFTVDGSPLRGVDFAGFDPTEPYWLNPFADRVRPVEHPALKRLAAGYADTLLAAGWEPIAAVEPGTRLPNGLVFDRRLAELHEIAGLQGTDFGDLRTDEGCARFTAWLSEPARRGAAHGINRYTERVWTERSDVVRVFADLDGDDGAGYVAWLWEWGRQEMGVPQRFVPPNPAGDEGDAALPPIHVVGFMKGTLGLGAAARLYVEAINAADLEVSTETVAPPTPEDEDDDGPAGPYSEVDFTDRVRPDSDGAVDIVCVNADELPVIARQLGPAFGRGRRTIGVWAWETDDIPERWAHAYPLVDEVWTYTRYVAESIARVSPVPVISIPIPVPTPDPAGGDPGVELPDGFRFLFVFDFLSTPARKNPGGLVRAFTRAFAPGEGPQLVIKTLHGDLRPKWLDQLRWLAGARDDIHIVDRSLSTAQRDALMDSCDCYVSLHRAEGFGLTIAEAMALGKPVIATAYSGNLDFMNTSNGYLVDYEMTKVGPQGEQYPADGTWADPSIEHAAALMRQVVERPEEARAKGERARRDVAAQLSPEAVGRIIRARLQRLQDLGEL
jgi:glycosyltransferase involved in cell wall biosynthesis